MPSKILVVENVLDSRNLLHFLFTTKGYTVITACDGREGLYLAKIETPDLIISDFSMPDMDGTELVKQLRLDPKIVLFNRTSARSLLRT